MKAVTIDALVVKLEKLGHVNPEKLAAVNTLVDMALRDERATMTADRGVRNRLLSRLQARHDCPHQGGGGFEQLQPQGRVRRWRCDGCGLIVTLD